MVIFPYELPPLVVAAHLGGVRIGPLIRLLLAMTILAWLVIVPLQFVWWRYLGYFGYIKPIKCSGAGGLSFLIIR